MPNWCNNKATFTPVTDEAKQLLKEFTEYLQDLKDPNEARLFGWFCPMPESEKDNWYQWNIANWGTKWDVSVSIDNIYPQEGIMDFYEDTAWGPPVKFYDFMTEKGFKVEASYYEPGAGFVGTYSDGVDDSEDIPTGDEAFAIIRETSYDDQEIVFENNIELDNLKSGDVLGVNQDGNSVIYLSHKFYTWEEFMHNNRDLFESDVVSWENDLEEILTICTDFYIIEFIDDNSKCGSTKGIVYPDEMNKISFPR